MNWIQSIIYMNHLILICALISMCGMACHSSSSPDSVPSSIHSSSKIVEVRQTGDTYQLYRHGEVYPIRGAATGDQSSYLLSLSQAGGNAIRTYTTDQAGSILDSAAMLGIGVMLGLYMIPAEQGMAYEDPSKVQQQLDSLLVIVQTWKHHPALLMWGLGNEVELHRSEPGIWKAINQLSQAIHQLDPDHPTVAVVLPNPKSLQQLTQYCPDVDILGINSFGSMSHIANQISRQADFWTGPVLFTEWGIPGPWEVNKTAWQAPIEWNSTQKAHYIHQNGQLIRGLKPQKCLGGFVFFWGTKMERTHTWFNVFGEGGEKTSMYDQLHYFWKESWPDNRSPLIDSIFISTPASQEEVYLKTGHRYNAVVSARDPEGKGLEYSWEILPESSYRTFIQAGHETRPRPLSDLLLNKQDSLLDFHAPKQSGAYRLFAYVHDSNGKLATANLPFYVTMASPLQP
ncbi:MAG: glycoside hydrolase family 2 TIM barrel-domain containing protein [Bacteroidota bacterium]